MATGNVRARLFRAKDGAVIHGWVVGERGNGFLLSTESQVPIQSGESFLCELFSLDSIVKSVAVAKIVDTRPGTDSEPAMTTVALERVQVVSVSKGKGNERIRVDSVTANLLGPAGFAPKGCPVLDISSKGMAVVVPGELEEGREILVDVLGVEFPISLTCTVRYCRAFEAGFRVGLQLTGMDRVATAKWAQIVYDHGVERPKVA